MWCRLQCGAIVICSAKYNVCLLHQCKGLGQLKSAGLAVDMGGVNDGMG